MSDHAVDVTTPEQQAAIGALERGAPDRGACSFTSPCPALFTYNAIVRISRTH